MKLTFISHNPASRRLIIIFAGWSSNIEFYRSSKIDGWDLLICHDYDTIEPLGNKLDQYSTIYLYAWSLGVAAAEIAMQGANVTRAYAINGSPVPVSDLFGIPTQIYHSTRDNLNERNLAKFRRRMVNSAVEMNELTSFLIGEDDVDNLKLQLSTIENLTSQDTNNRSIKWNRAYISTEDKIFPIDNLRLVWEKYNCNTEVITLNRPHYFPIDGIVKNTVPDTSCIGSAFKEALTTYTSNSLPQQKIANHLASIIPYEKRVIKDVVEIGTGTGYFTSKYFEKISPESIIHIDLFPIPHLNLIPSEEYVVEDAEEWMENTDNDVDLILSASAIQWFCDIDTFFRNCSRILKKRKGKLICSTFGKQNLKELNELRPSPIYYLSVDEIKGSLEKYFDDVEIEEELITEKFDSVCELLKHLRDTGVKGNAAGHRSLKRIVSIFGDIPSLTYHPIYIRAGFRDTDAQI